MTVSYEYSPDGAAGTIREGYRWIEEQRQGTEWIARGCARGKDDWMRLGWLQLDWGLVKQQARWVSHCTGAKLAEGMISLRARNKALKWFMICSQVVPLLLFAGHHETRRNV